MIRGVVIWLCACLLAWPLSRLYQEPQLAYLIPVVSFTAVISGFNSTAYFTLNRRLAHGPHHALWEALPPESWAGRHA